MYYYIVRDSEHPASILAIHQVLDSAVAVFHMLRSKPCFRGYLDIIRISTNEQGIKTSEVIVQKYSSVSGECISHEFVDGILHIMYSSTPLSIRTPKK
jgi:hypothetical protein